MKICTRCKGDKELAAFGKQTGGANGLKAWCKRCCLDYKKEHYDNNVKVKNVINPIDNERWLPLISYEGLYEVSDMGRIKSLSRASINGRDIQEKILKGRLTRYGYLIAYAYKDGARNNIVIHRAVGIAFVRNPCNYMEINHINGIKEDNSSSNLEWCTRSYNLKHAYRLGLRKSKKGIKVKKAA